MNSPVRIGIVGGGQLGRMLTFAAKKMGFSVTIVDPTPNSPAGQVADKQIVGGYKDENAIRELARTSDVLTVDAEFVNDEVLSQLEKTGKKIHPSPQTIAIIKDKLLQKQFLQKNNVPTAECRQIKTKKDLRDTAKIFGYPLLLKARFDAYDGKGNSLIQNEKEIDAGFKKLEDRRLYVEKFIPFVKELAVMVARGENGEIVTYPVVETIQKNNICDTVIAPAEISKKAADRAILLAKKVMQHLRGSGVFGIEMFLTKDHDVLVNEIAPRVHNSGHYTIESCVTSQFEQHIRAITGLPLGITAMLTKVAVMKNILGEKNGSGFPKGIEKALEIPGVSLHVYGKHESRPGRKMGHITVVGDSMQNCLKSANQARAMLTI